MDRKEYFKKKVEHIDIKATNIIPVVEAMDKMAFQARNLSRGAQIFDKMVADKDCTVFLTLAGSLISAGLKKTITTLVQSNMVDCIVSTGANIVDQDFFEALGYSHYQGNQFGDDQQLRELLIDRIYDTYIDENELRACDETIADLCDSLPRKAYTSREFIYEMGKYLDSDPKFATSRQDSIVYNCYKKGIPIFCPAFSDCSAGFGFVMHKQRNPHTQHISIDSAADFYELTQIKIHSKQSGIFMIGGGVPKNYIQDTVVAAEVLGVETTMHKYAVQITVADERDGALSGSTLKEACSWGKVDTVYEQMIFCEATIAFPLIAGYAYHKNHWQQRQERRFNEIYQLQSL